MQCSKVETDAHIKSLTDAYTALQQENVAIKAQVQLILQALSKDSSPPTLTAFPATNPTSSLNPTQVSGTPRRPPAPPITPSAPPLPTTPPRPVPLLSLPGTPQPTPLATPHLPVPSLPLQTPRSSRPQIQTKNRFSVLKDLVDIEPEIVSSEHESITHVFGDSRVRDMGRAFKIDNKQRQVHVYPGATIDDIDHAISQHNDDRNQCLVVNIGTNDANHRRSTPNAVITKYRRLLTTMAKKSQHRYVVNVAPRLNASANENRKISEINERLKMLCEDTGVTYIDAWSSFHDRTTMYKRDGVHFTRRGTRLLASLISHSMCNQLDFLHLNLLT